MKFTRLLISMAIGLALPSSALADFQRWSADVEKDPFSGGERVVVSYMANLRSAVFVFCDTAQPGIEVRVIPGYVYDAQMQDMVPLMEFAMDGERVIGAPGSIAVVGDNLTAISATMMPMPADKFVKAFASAKKQVAIKDGLTDRPQLLRAAGSTKSGAALVNCMSKQAAPAATPTAPSPSADDPAKMLDEAMKQLSEQAATMTPDQKAAVVVAARTKAEAAAKAAGQTPEQAKLIGDQAEAAAKRALGLL